MDYLCKSAISCLLLVWIHCQVASSFPGKKYVFPDHKQAEFANSLEHYEISVPTKVSSLGNFKSHTLQHSVHKRDVARDLYYQVQVEGEDLHLALRPNHKLLAPGMLVERKTAQFGNITDSAISRYSDNRCHFSGSVKGHEKSVAAIATCSGLMGFLRTSKGEYFIEPVKGHNHTEDPRHPHLIYKRAALKPQYANEPDHMTCGVEDHFKSEEEKRERWDRIRRSAKSENREQKRKKRSVSVERMVETLVVVDTKMVEYYKGEDIENYVLTIMNMVSIMYHEASIGNAVNIVLVKLIFLDEEQKDLKITHHADHTLQSFCKWQKKFNPKDDNHPNHHDVAVLLTRYNICSRMNEPCSTLGLSQVSGMCQPHRSCNVNEDTGLALAYTVAHEIGHNFGMQHDTMVNHCEPEAGEVQHVMSPELSADSTPLVWSNCSRRAITKFLDRDWGYCLDDEPSEHDFVFPELPPGVMYDVDHQCRLQYGPEAQYCEGIDEICSTLWCQVDNKCLTRLEAAAQGTLCGDNEWCFGGRCVTIGENPQSINGGWGEWQGWTSCSRTCGAGVSITERHCDNPAPSNGGNYCLGERKRYRICNTEACSDDSRNFRAQQCEEFNTIPYKGKVFQWEPVPTPVTPCQLHCKPSNLFFSVMLKDMVTDGTPCRSGGRDMCITGRCRKVGCDWVIDSTAKEDRCGVCHGDGASCKTVSDKFEEKQGMGYVDAITIPEGARNIRIEEVAEANNYLAVRNDEGKFFLNGDWFIQWSGDYEGAGTVIHYERTGNKEKMELPGPLKESIHIMLLFQSDNPGVEFEYTVPDENATETLIREFSWKYRDWTHCTASCGGGSQRSEVLCVEREAGIVDNTYCNATTKPDDLQRSCNVHLCPARWWTGPWQHCSMSCGNHGLRRRTVICVRSLGPDEQIALDDHKCKTLEKPHNREPCRHKEPCQGDAIWTTGPWSQTCHGDPCSVQSRTVECSDRNAICDTTNKPITKQQCGNITCGTWTAGNWSECTRSCGSGIQLRSVVCSGGQACLLTAEPSMQQDCNTQRCPSNVHTHHYAADTKPGMQSGLDIWSQALDGSIYSLDGTDSSTNQKSGKQQIGGTTAFHKLDTTTSFPQVHDKKKSSTRDSENVIHTNNEKSESEHLEDYETLKILPSVDYRWIPLSWEECSKQCGPGEERREVKCIYLKTSEEANPVYCAGDSKPSDIQPCNIQPCHKWSVSKWSKCSKTCGPGEQHRRVICPQDETCDLDLKPEIQKACNLQPCSDWIVGQWSQCSQSCGGGEQVRHVQCISLITSKTSLSCDPQQQPTAIQNCQSQDCPDNALTQPDYHCKANIMSFSVCKSLQRMGQCRNRYIQLKCCKTCHPRPNVDSSGPET